MVVLQRRYRVLVDVVVELSALQEADEMCKEDTLPCHTWQPDPLAARRNSWAAQGRLLHALLRAPSALEAWLRREAVRHVLDSGLEPFSIDTDEEELLRPVIACLPPPDREFFEEAIELDEFCELADPFLDTTSAKVIGISVVDRVLTTTETTHALALGTYRVAIDVEASIRGIDEPEVESHWHTLQERYDCELEVTPDRFARLQCSLLTTLQRCEQELDLWLKQEVLREIVDYGDEPSFQEPSDREILGPVISRLDPADRLRFEALLDDGTLYEGARAFYHAVSASTRQVTVAEMPTDLPLRWTIREQVWPASGPRWNTTGWQAD